MISGRQIKAARILLGWSQEILAVKALVSLRTLTRLETESGESGPSTISAERVKKALEDAGIQFFFEDGKAGEGLRVRLKDAKR